MRINLKATLFCSLYRTKKNTPYVITVAIATENIGKLYFLPRSKVALINFLFQGNRRRHKMGRQTDNRIE